jgi:hypothetical protein
MSDFVVQFSIAFLYSKPSHWHTNLRMWKVQGVLKYNAKMHHKIWYIELKNCEDLQSVYMNEFAVQFSIAFLNSMPTT